MRLEVIELPYIFVRERFFTRKRLQTLFVQQASPFQDFVIRCVRYAFAKIPAKIGRVFFSKQVALPFLRFRLLRHGYIASPVTWREIDKVATNLTYPCTVYTLSQTSKNGFSGLYIVDDETREPDVLVYYCHGGGFSMGSVYFYLEPLLGLFSMLKANSQYRNPAIFALEYSLVPYAQYPTQLSQTLTGYLHALSLVSNDASRVCVAGDSAGATLVLSLLLHIAKKGSKRGIQRPGYAALLSPWVTLVSDKNRDTPSDYLNAESLHLYGTQYAGEHLLDPLVSPGLCNDFSRWAAAAPLRGFYFTYGSEEVFGPEIRELIFKLRKSGISVSVKEEPGGIHAWVIARLFLEDSREERVRGMRELVKAVAANILAA